MESFDKNRGFTLTEMIIVIIIIGILSAAVFIRWSKSTTDLDAQKALLVNDLRYTQNLSMSRNERYRFVIISSIKYDIQDSNGNSQEIPSTANGNLISGITLSSPINIIIFDGRGTPYNGSTTPESLITSEVIITLQNSAGQTRTIHITPLTGKVSI